MKVKVKHIQPQPDITPELGFAALLLSMRQSSGHKLVSSLCTVTSLFHCGHTWAMTIHATSQELGEQSCKVPSTLVQNGQREQFN